MCPNHTVVSCHTVTLIITLDLDSDLDVQVAPPGPPGPAGPRPDDSDKATAAIEAFESCLGYMLHFNFFQQNRTVIGSGTKL